MPLFSLFQPPPPPCFVVVVGLKKKIVKKAWDNFHIFYNGFVHFALPFQFVFCSFNTSHRLVTIRGDDLLFMLKSYTEVCYYIL